MERVISKLRTLSLSSLLAGLSGYSLKAYVDVEPIRTIHVGRVSRPNDPPQDFIVPIWEIVFLEYLSLLHCDEAVETKATDNDVIWLLSELKRLADEDVPQELDGLEPSEIIMKLIFGLAQQQISYQHICRDVVGYFNRNFEILFVLSREVGLFPDFDEACRKETGLSLAEYLNNLVIFWSQVRTGVPVDRIVLPHESEGVLPGVANDNIQKLIKYNSIKRDKVAKSPLKENILIALPIVEVSGTRWVVDHFYMSCKFFDGPYWAIRNHYLKKNDQHFINKFGELAELYVGNALSKTIPGQFLKLPTIVGEKSADWRIETPSFVIFVEQKTCVAPLPVRRNLPDLEQTRGYFDRLVEAVDQLRSSSIRDQSEKRRFHIVVVFDRLFMLDAVVKPAITTPLEYLQFVNIAEFEELIAILSEDPASLDELIDEKIITENTPRQRDMTAILGGKNNGYAIKCLDHFRNTFRVGDP